MRGPKRWKIGIPNIKFKIYLKTTISIVWIADKDLKTYLLSERKAGKQENRWQIGRKYCIVQWFHSENIFFHLSWASRIQIQLDKLGEILFLSAFSFNNANEISWHSVDIQFTSVFSFRCSKTKQKNRALTLSSGNSYRPSCFILDTLPICWTLSIPPLKLKLLCRRFQYK